MCIQSFAFIFFNRNITLYCNLNISYNNVKDRIAEIILFLYFT